MLTLTKRSLKVVVAITIALTVLTLTLVSLALASNTSPANSFLAVPPARPHNPNSGVYTLYDNLTPGEELTATYQWLEINNSADFTWNLGGDFSDDGDTSQSFPIGFIFPFYDDFYTEFRVSEKGYIFFEKPGVDVGRGGMPALIPTNDISGSDGANNFIAPFAGDLFGYPGVSHIYIRNDTSPRRTIIEFENVVWCCGQNNPRTFQVILYPGGAIEMQYLKVTGFPGPLDEGQIVRMGLENLDGSAGDVYTQGFFSNIDAATGPGFLIDGLAIRYERSLSGATAIFLPDTRTIWDDPGRSITTTSNLYLIANETVTGSFDITYSLTISSNLPQATWAQDITYTVSAVVTGTYSSTLQFVLPISTAVIDFSDLATAVFTAESTNLAPPVTATFVVIYGPAHRDLQIQKNLDPNIPPAPGGAFRYRLTVTNTDLNDSDRAAIAYGVKITDTLQTGVTYEDCRRSPYYQSCASWVTTNTIAAGTAITIDLDTMNIDEVETIYLELRNSNASSPVDNTAHVTTTESVELGNGPNNHSHHSFTVATSEKDLRVRKYYWRNNNYIAAGQAIPFNIHFYNDGREEQSGNYTLTDIIIEDLLPENTTFNRAELSYEGPDLSPPGPITPAVSEPMSRTLTFTIPAVDNGSWNYANLRLWVNIPQTIPIGTRLTNTVEIDGGGTDKKDDTEVVEVASNYVDPFVDKGPSREQNGDIIPPEPGKDYTYWITYGNRSVLTDATDFIITDTLPASVTLVSASPGQYLAGPFTSTMSGRTVISWYTNTLPAGAMGQVVIIVSVDSSVAKGSLLVNQMVVTYTGTFTPSTNLDDTDILTTEVASDIHGSEKQVNNPNPIAGGEVEYTIVVSHTGDSTTAFTVTDSLPPELTYVSDSASPSTGFLDSGGGNISWTGNIDPNQELEFTFRARVTETAQIDDVISNTANIAIAGGTNVNRQVDVTVAGGVFGNSRKTASPALVASGGRVDYTIAVTNSGSAVTSITVTDTLPPSVTLTSSFNPSSGAVTPSGDNRAFTWTTNVDSSNPASLSFQVTVTDGLTNGVTIDNVAYLDDGSPIAIPLTATITISNTVGGGIYMPVIMKQ